MNLRKHLKRLSAPKTPHLRPHCFAIMLLAVAVLVLVSSPIISRWLELRARTSCAARLSELARTDFTGTPARILQCPNAPRPSYIFVPLTSPTRSNVPPIVAYEPIENHAEGGNILYADGHVEWADRKTYEDLLLATRPSGAK